MIPVRIWCFQSTQPRIHISPEGGKKKVYLLGPFKKWEQFENALQALRAQSILLISFLTKQPTISSWSLEVSHTFFASVPESYKWPLLPVTVTKVNGSWGLPVKTVDVAQGVLEIRFSKWLVLGGWDEGARYKQNTAHQLEKKACHDKRQWHLNPLECTTNSTIETGGVSPSKPPGQFTANA